MTREEMIEQLENTILLIKQNGRDWWDDRDIPILEEAIKAMKTESCDSCISREEVANEFANWFGYNYQNQFFYKRLKDMKPIQPEQKIERWIPVVGEPRNGVKVIFGYKCSRCNRFKTRDNFCSNCGAKMKTDEEMTVDEVIKQFSDNAEHEQSHESIQRHSEFRQLAELLAELKKLKEREWIPVIVKLPKEEEKSYWVCLDTGYQCECRWTNSMHGVGANEWDEWGWHIMDKPQYSRVVAWKPLPESYHPKEGE